MPEPKKRRISDPDVIVLDSPPAAQSTGSSRRAPRNRVAKPPEPDCMIVEVRQAPAVSIVSERVVPQPPLSRMIFPHSYIQPTITHHVMPRAKRNQMIKAIQASVPKPKDIPPEPEVAPAMLKCAICLTLASEQTKLCSTNCGHIFCMECLESALKVVRKCPICRANVSKKGFHPLHI